MSQIMIRALTPADWPSVKRIYQEGIDGGNATFETGVPEWLIWDKNHRQDCRLAAVLGGAVVGWAALSPASARQVYAGVAEVSVYVAESARGQGIGKRLLSALVVVAEQAGVWTLQAGILRENLASIKLHESCGFRQVGYRERLGQLKGVWRDVVLMERRSHVVGNASGGF